jgi:hypothetical protein
VCVFLYECVYVCVCLYVCVYRAQDIHRVRFLGELLDDVDHIGAERAVFRHNLFVCQQLDLCVCVSVCVCVPAARPKQAEGI